MFSVIDALKDVASWCKARNHIGASASARGNTSSQTLPNSTITVVNLNTWIQRTDTGFTFSNYGIKVPYAGTVLISGNVYVGGSASSDLIGCYLRLNGAEISSQYTAGVRGGLAGGITMTQVKAGDVITLCARSSPSRNAAPSNPSTHLDVTYIK